MNMINMINIGVTTILLQQKGAKELLQNMRNSTNSFSLNSQIQHSQSAQISISQIYVTLLNQWLNSEFEGQNTGRSRKATLRNHNYTGDSFYSNTFLPKLRKMTQLQITFDACIYRIIIKMLTQTQFMRITKSAGKESKYQPKYDKLVQFAEILAAKKFITNKMVENIKDLTSSENSIQSKIQKIIFQVSACKYVNTERLQEIWEKYFIHHSINYIWMNILLKNQQALQPELLGSLFKIYKEFLPYKSKPQLFSKLRLMLEIEEMDKSELLTHLLLDQQQLNEAEYSQKFQLELHILYNYINQAIRQKNDQITVSFELFGSCRSGFRLQDSDIDITIFCKESNKDYPTINILKTIHEYFLHLEGYTFQSQHISGAKVPVLKLELNNQIIKNADIVLNNAHGVQNSRFLQNYSQNPKIKLFGILIKKWSKSFDLIGIKKFSSYSIIFMVLFYLIKKGKLKPAERIFNIRKLQKQRGNRMRQSYKPVLRANNILQKQIDLFEDFKQFLKFYSKKGYFSDKNQTICLIQPPKYLPSEQLEMNGPEEILNCHRVHQKNEKYYYLFNMHDPFDDSNPGRFLKQDQQQFYAAIDKSLTLLETNDNRMILNVLSGNNMR